MHIDNYTTMILEYKHWSMFADMKEYRQVLETVMEPVKPYHQLIHHI